MNLLYQIKKQAWQTHELNRSQYFLKKEQCTITNSKHPTFVSIYSKKAICKPMVSEVNYTGFTLTQLKLQKKCTRCAALVQADLR